MPDLCLLSGFLLLILIPSSLENLGLCMCLLEEEYAYFAGLPATPRYLSGRCTSGCAPQQQESLTLLPDRWLKKCVSFIL